MFTLPQGTGVKGREQVLNPRGEEIGSGDYRCEGAMYGV